MVVYYLDSNYKRRTKQFTPASPIEFEENSFILSIMDGAKRVVPLNAVGITEFESVAIGNPFYDANVINNNDFSTSRTVIFSNIKDMFPACCDGSSGAPSSGGESGFGPDWVDVEYLDTGTNMQQTTIKLGWFHGLSRRVNLGFELHGLNASGSIMQIYYNNFDVPGGTSEFIKVVNTTYNELQVTNIILKYIELVSVDGVVLINRPKIYERFIES